MAMDETDIKNIISGDKKILNEALDNFLQKCGQITTFTELKCDLRKDLWKALYHNITDNAYSFKCLSCTRILSRDKEYLDEVVDENWINTLMNLSGLNVNKEQSIPDKVIIEAMKCLCNLVFNSKVVQTICAKNEIIDLITKRLLTYRDLEVLDEVKYFDMKLLFLITALCINVRTKLKELNGLTYLIEYLAFILNYTPNETNGKNKIILLDEQVNIICEILKVLFNITYQIDLNVDEEEDASYMKLTSLLHDYLLISTQSEIKKLEMHSHIINLLTALPESCLKELITVNRGQTLNEDLEFDGYNMEAVYILLQFLKRKFQNESQSNTDPAALRAQELLSPVLTTLTKISKCSRAARKYLRKQILPPLRDVHTRPEQGNTLRNNLCKLLTTPMTQVRDLAADLLFVLCKESVVRMVKYTGYGNAAGLFASRGLLGRNSNQNANYSSDSEDSDTEEYTKYKHGINPVIGCYEPPHPNPTEGMTEEQKEYEALKLVNLMDTLQRQGLIQPCRIGEDGRPEPIEHVLQLKEEYNEKADS